MSTNQRFNFEPRIIAFLCNWCSYQAADLAGTSRTEYAPNLRVIRVMCSGRVDSQLILKTFKEGADGVLIAGCHPGDCHYQEGNYKTLRRYILLKKLISQLGIKRDRLELEWISASEGNKFAQVVNDFTTRIRQLGPLGTASDQKMKKVKEFQT